VRVVNVKGFDSTIGYTQWANKPAKEDAAVRFVLPNPPITYLLRIRTYLYSSSRRSAQQAPSSSPRRTSHRLFSPLRAATLSGAARAIHGRPPTPQVAPQAVRAHCSRRMAPRSVSVRTLGEVYVFRRGIVGFLVLSPDLGVCHLWAPSVSASS
jgi:hypothetical protein